MNLAQLFHDPDAPIYRHFWPKVEEVKLNLKGMAVTTHDGFAKKEVQPKPTKKDTGVYRMIEVYEYVTDTLQATQEIIRSSGLENSVVLRNLKRLQRAGKIKCIYYGKRPRWSR